jgi:hypothetical protein
MGRNGAALPFLTAQMTMMTTYQNEQRKAVTFNFIAPDRYAFEKNSTPGNTILTHCNVTSSRTLPVSNNGQV